MSISADQTPPAVMIIAEHQPRAAADTMNGRHSPTNPNHTTTETGGGLFSLSAGHADLVNAYPDLKPICTRLGFADGMTLERWCSSPEWMLLILARAAQPPQPAARLDWANTHIPGIIDHLVGCHHRTMRNELSRIAILIRDFTYRHSDQDSTFFGHDFLRFEADTLVRLDFEEIAVFPPCLDMSIQLCGTNPGKKTVDIALRLHAMMVNNDHSAIEIGLLLNQLTGLMHRHSDPDLTIIKQSLAFMALEMAAHATTERNLLASEVLFLEELRIAQANPSYCIQDSGEPSLA